MKPAVILLGSNMGNRFHNLESAQEKLMLCFGQVQLQSLIYKTAPWGNTNQDDFLNKVIVVNSDKDAFEILKILLTIEVEIGRTRTGKWASRTIDLDLLYLGNEIIDTKSLMVPHPHIQDRKFTLIPLCEILPDFIHPLFQLSNKELLLQTTDKSDVYIYEH